MNTPSPFFECVGQNVPFYVTLANDQNPIIINSASIIKATLVGYGYVEGNGSLNFWFILEGINPQKTFE